MHIASRMMFDPMGAFEQICGMIPGNMLEPLARDLATNMVIAADKHGEHGPYRNRHMIELATPLLEPCHMDEWALQIKKGTNIEPDDLEAFVMLLYGVLGAALVKDNG